MRSKVAPLSGDCCSASVMCSAVSEAEGRGDKAPFLLVPGNGDVRPIARSASQANIYRRGGEARSTAEALLKVKQLFLININ